MVDQVEESIQSFEADLESKQSFEADLESKFNQNFNNTSPSSHTNQNNNQTINTRMQKSNSSIYYKDNSRLWMQRRKQIFEYFNRLIQKVEQIILKKLKLKIVSNKKNEVELQDTELPTTSAQKSKNPKDLTTEEQMTKDVNNDSSQNSKQSAKRSRNISLEEIPYDVTTPGFSPDIPNSLEAMFRKWKCLSTSNNKELNETSSTQGNHSMINNINNYSFVVLHFFILVFSLEDENPLTANP